MVTTDTYTGDVYHVANDGFSLNGNGTTYSYDGPYFFPIANSQIWTNDDGIAYSGNRYYRVANGDANTTYNLGFIDGEMQTITGG